AARERDVTLHFRLPDHASEFHIRLSGGAVAAETAPPAEAADVQLRLPADVLDGMFTGRANAMQAAMDGKPSFTGDTTKPQALQQLQGELGRCYRAAREEIGDPGDLTPVVDAPAAAAIEGSVGADDPRLALIQVVNELYAQQLITATGGNV